jgi:transposase
MEKQRDKVCGADIHKRFLVATILSRDGCKIKDRFGMNVEDLLKFKDWVIRNDCEEVAVESTGIYWIPIYTILEDKVRVIVANAHKIKHTPGRKTDVSDSEWIAELCLNGMIEPSRIFPKHDRELRSLTRAREGYVNNRTQMKNRIHKELESSCIKLSSVLVDVFGKSGRHILDCLLEGKSVDEILSEIKSTRIRNKDALLREALSNSLNTTQCILIRTYLDMIDSIQIKIEELDRQIMSKIMRRKDELAIAMSIPGIGFVSGAAILAEIGNREDFKTSEQLAAYCGLTPSVFQSADKLITGSITKHGSKHIRRMLIQVAHIIYGSRDSTLKRFFLRIKGKKGSKIAAVALARKVICILHHLLKNGEKYEDNGIVKDKPVKIDRTCFPIEMTLREMIETIVKAGYEVTKMRSGEYG